MVCHHDNQCDRRHGAGKDQRGNQNTRSPKLAAPRTVLAIVVHIAERYWQRSMAAIGNSTETPVVETGRDGGSGRSPSMSSRSACGVVGSRRLRDRASGVRGSGASHRPQLQSPRPPCRQAPAKIPSMNQCAPSCNSTLKHRVGAQWFCATRQSCQIAGHMLQRIVFSGVGMSLAALPTGQIDGRSKAIHTSGTAATTRRVRARRCVTYPGCFATFASFARSVPSASQRLLVTSTFLASLLVGSRSIWTS